LNSTFDDWYKSHFSDCEYVHPYFVSESDKIPNISFDFMLSGTLYRILFYRTLDGTYNRYIGIVKKDHSIVFDPLYDKDDDVLFNLREKMLFATDAIFKLPSVRLRLLSKGISQNSFEHDTRVEKILIERGVTLESIKEKPHETI